MSRNLDQTLNLLYASTVEVESPLTAGKKAYSERRIINIRSHHNRLRSKMMKTDRHPQLFVFHFRRLSVPIRSYDDVFTELPLCSRTQGIEWIRSY